MPQRPQRACFSRKKQEGQRRACVRICFSCVQLFVNLGTIARQAPLSVGILQARILEWVAMPSSISDPGIEPESLRSLALAGGFFTTSTT